MATFGVDHEPEGGGRIKAPFILQKAAEKNMNMSYILSVSLCKDSFLHTSMLNNQNNQGDQMEQYYFNTNDLAAFSKINEVAEEQGNKFFDYYGSATSEGLLSQREKALIALTVATVEKCPYCIDAYTNTCLSLGISEEEMMEAIHVGASMQAGITLAHATQMRRIVRQKEM